jgi:hypothetical protein
METTYYHAGPAGLTSLQTARTLIDEGIITIEDYAQAWESKWGDTILDPWSLMAHPAIDEICFFDNRADAEQLASTINGEVYAVSLDQDEVVINNEGVPSIRRAVNL